MRRKMNFEEFKNAVMNSIKNWLPDTFGSSEVSVSVVTKNNDVKLTGLLIKKVGSAMAPMIYLESFYKEYEGGKGMEQILQKIAKVRMDHDDTDLVDMNMVSELSGCQDKIMPRLIGGNWNKDILENRPHVMISDLAVTFVIDLGMHEEGSMTIPITNEMLKIWGASSEELYAIAIKNLEDSEGVFVTMFEMLTGLIGDAVPKDMIPEESLYVLTNESKIHGASMLLNKKLMTKVIERVGKDFYIVPSSVHEVLIVPRNDKMRISDLDYLVRDINESQVDVPDRLSDHIYRYTEEGLISA